MGFVPAPVGLPPHPTGAVGPTGPLVHAQAGRGGRWCSVVLSPALLLPPLTLPTAKSLWDPQNGRCSLGRMVRKILGVVNEDAGDAVEKGGCVEHPPSPGRTRAQQMGGLVGSCHDAGEF